MTRYRPTPYCEDTFSNHRLALAASVFIVYRARHQETGGVVAIKKFQGGSLHVTDSLRCY